MNRDLYYPITKIVLRMRIEDMSQNLKSADDFSKNPFPNSLFLEWINELYLNAKKSNSNSQYTYKKAIFSLKRYPIALKSPREALIIQNIGKGIVDKIESKWNRYLLDNKNEDSQGPNDEENVLTPSPIKRCSSFEVVSNCSTIESTTNFLSQPTVKTKNKTKEYIPQYRTGPFAILIGLLDSLVKLNKVSLTKTELINIAQPYCDSSFTIAQPLGSFYTAWNSMSLLIKKNLVEKDGGRMSKFKLTASGLDLAKKLKSANKTIASENLQESSILNPPSLDSIELSLDSFDIFLVVDNIEAVGKSSRSHQLIKALKNTNLNISIRKLNIGDFTWIAKHKDHKNFPNHEIVLDFILERKRIDDLSHSIVDGRFDEQKFRLQKCGVKNIIYLVEGAKLTGQSINVRGLYQALTNTFVGQNFIIERTRDVSETVSFLINTTKFLISKYQSLGITSKSHGCNNESVSNFPTFDSLNEFSLKTKAPTVKELFIKFLAQIDGVSTKKAVEIANHYPTPRSLMEAYEGITDTEGREILLGNIIMKNNNKKIGKKTSINVYRLLFC